MNERSIITTIIVGAIIAATLVLLFGCQPSERQFDSAEGFGMSSPDQGIPVEELQSTEGYSHAHPSHTTEQVVEMRIYNDAGQGVSRGRGMEIQWRGNTSQGADTLAVTNAIIVRMQWEQNTLSMSSDQNSRALFHLMQARQTLEGKTTVTEDGLPIIE